MNGLLRLAMLLLAVATAFDTANVRAASAESSREPQLARSSGSRGAHDGTVSVEELIKQLGSDEYFLRKQAEQALLERGADAFDLLQQAESNPDLEIAVSAHYILQQIRIEWSQPHDSADVQAIMHRYGDLSRTERVEKMEQLLALADDDGLGALCRIARFEPAPHLARFAALKVMLAKPDVDRGTKSAETITMEIGDSERTPTQWLRAYADQVSHPELPSNRWLKLIDDEIALVDESSSESEAAFAFELIDFYLDLCRDKHQPEAVFEGLQRRTDLYVKTSGRLRDGLFHAMGWLWKNEQWDVFSLVEDNYAEAVRTDRSLLYFVAAARWKQGRDEVAEEIAERAFALEVDDRDSRMDIGDLIGEMGRHDWAEREWWLVIESHPVLDRNSIYARSRLASLRLHDRGEDKRAAVLMAEICDAVDADGQLKGDIMNDASRRLTFQLYRAQKEYFLACQSLADGDPIAQRKHLDASYDLNSDDPDVLIAMYRSPGADDAYRRTTVGRIQRAAHKVANKIEQDPDNSEWYNQWAWLISNTEGDYALAVKHSQRSLKLVPDSPSYLDTLGRCYYAAGDVENAVKSQREAVRLHPHMQVMRDQLRTFESALAAGEKK